MSTIEPVVRVRDLVVDRGGTRAVDGLGFTVRRGTITALLGPNGAGKTSTVEHLEGYLPRTRGEVEVLGLDPEHHRARLAPRVGIMLQQGGIPTAVRPCELLRQYASFFADPEDPSQLLDRVGLTDRARTAYRHLSGGEQQRLSLALAMVGRPELLFLDEPTAGVDLQGRDMIRSLVVELARQGRTVVLSTHDLTEAEQIADQVLIIDHGRLLASGTPAELIAATDGADLRFGAPVGLDTGALGAAIGAPTTEVSPGQYVVAGAPTPRMIAALTAWLADQGAAMGDMRASRQNLEDVFRRLTTEVRAPEGRGPEGRAPEGRGPDDTGTRPR